MISTDGASAFTRSLSAFPTVTMPTGGGDEVLWNDLGWPTKCPDPLGLCSWLCEMRVLCGVVSSDGESCDSCPTDGGVVNEFKHYKKEKHMVRCYMKR